MSLHFRPATSSFHCLVYLLISWSGIGSACAQMVSPASGSAEIAAGVGDGGPVLLEPKILRDPARGNMPAYLDLNPREWTL